MAAENAKRDDNRVESLLAVSESTGEVRRLRVGESTNALQVELGSGGLVPGTGATSLGKAEDAAHASGDTGVLALAVANEAGSNLSGTDGDYTPIRTNRAGTVYNQDTTVPVAEDNTIGVIRTEERFSYGRVTADGQIKASAGFIHTITFSATGTVTAGVITVYDNTAESGTVIFSGTIQTGLNPVTIKLNVTTTNGIYVGYDGTIANVATTVAYR